MPMNMTEIVRSRDLIVFFKGDNYTVTPGPGMVANGWLGGQGVTWIPGVNDERTVGISDGRYGGIAMFGSDEVADMHTGLSGTQRTARWVTILLGGSLISTSTYERYTWASRQAGPLVPLVYTPCQILYMSSRGYWTNEDEAPLTGALWGTNFFAGFVAQVPKANNNYFLGVQTSM
jgi:hypothetical protein